MGKAQRIEMNTIMALGPNCREVLLSGFADEASGIFNSKKQTDLLTTELPECLYLFYDNAFIGWKAKK